MISSLWFRNRSHGKKQPVSPIWIKSHVFSASYLKWKSSMFSLSPISPSEKQNPAPLY